MAEDTKFKYVNGKYVNRVSGEEIPDDEPVMLFRARDRHAIPTLLHYLECVEDAHHKQAVKDRIRDFVQFVIDHPDRMKEPGITRHMTLKDEFDENGEAHTPIRNMGQIAMRYTVGRNQTLARIHTGQTSASMSGLEYCDKPWNDLRIDNDVDLMIIGTKLTWDGKIHTHSGLRRFSEEELALKKEMSDLMYEDCSSGRESKRQTLLAKLLLAEMKARRMEDVFIKAQNIKQYGEGSSWGFGFKVNSEVTSV